MAFALTLTYEVMGARKKLCCAYAYMAVDMNANREWGTLKCNAHEGDFLAFPNQFSSGGFLARFHSTSSAKYRLELLGTTYHVTMFRLG